MAACSSSPAAEFPEEAVAVRASSDLAVGRERLLVGISTPSGDRLGSPEQSVDFAISPAGEPDRVMLYPATFTWIVPDNVGIYRAEVDFDRAGVWEVTVVPAEGDSLAPTLFEVAEVSQTPGPGRAAPLVPTPTLADRPIEALTTDPSPESALYELSLDEAFTSGRRSVVVFATPAFCRTAACGPMLELIKEVAPEHDDVNFVHVEIYDGFGEPGFVPDGAHLAPAVVAWNLQSEPWVFVVDDAGVIAARFEGVIDGEELAAALTG